LSGFSGAQAEWAVNARHLKGRLDRLEKQAAKCELVCLTSWFAASATRANKEAGELGCQPSQKT